MRDKLASWEGYLRSILRIILAFTFSLHGYRLALGFFAAARGGRRNAPAMALDTLPHMLGYLGIIAGVLLFLGLFTRLTAAILSIEVAIAYLTSSALRGPWTIRNGGEEAIAYLILFLYLAATGAGPWSLDYVIEKKRHKSVDADFRVASAPARM
jgi:putative oxidoreductase